jgi:hypothetical protein
MGDGCTRMGMRGDEGAEMGGAEAASAEMKGGREEAMDLEGLMG